MKTLFPALFLIASACGPAWSKPKKAEPAPTPSPEAPAAPTRGPAASFERATPPSTPEELIAHFEVLDRKLSSLKGRYVQTVTMDETGTVQTIEGKIAYLKPDRLRIEHVRPERQLVVSDGKAIWVHRLSSNQVIHSELADWRKADPMINSLLDFGGYAALGKRYDVAYSSATRLATLTPKEKGADYTLRLTLADKTYFPVETELRLAQMSVRTKLEGLEFNPKLPEEDFSFTPPAGADVFRNFKPPRLSP
ncbi:MAG: outer-membrane lipoprotein carrier protein LolA [Elusimicrobia bacterium]|nr:outer-membrane lipoprotein carrier protein LolA [Elusimicrobiota bacterium]